MNKEKITMTTDVIVTRYEDRIEVKNDKGTSWTMQLTSPSIDNSTRAGIAVLTEAMLTGTIVQYLNSAQELRFTLKLEF